MSRTRATPARAHIATALLNPSGYKRPTDPSPKNQAALFHTALHAAPETTPETQDKNPGVERRKETSSGYLKGPGIARKALWRTAMRVPFRVLRAHLSPHRERLGISRGSRPRREYPPHIRRATSKEADSPSPSPHADAFPAKSVARQRKGHVGGNWRHPTSPRRGSRIREAARKNDAPRTPRPKIACGIFRRPAQR